MAIHENSSRKIEQKLKPTLKNRTKEKITKIRKKKHIQTKENELKKMKAMGRLEPATFRFVGEHINH